MVIITQLIVQGTETCVSWDFTLQDWVSDGCNTTIGEGGVITCTCNHLTNFAVLVVRIIITVTA